MPKLLITGSFIKSCMHRSFEQLSLLETRPSVSVYTMSGPGKRVQQHSLRIGDIVFLYSNFKDGRDYVFSECSRYKLKYTE